MIPQILVPLHTYPDGNSVNIAAHVGQIAQHLQADVHGLVLNARFPRSLGVTGNLIINVDSMVSEVTAKCHARGVALAQAVAAELTQRGLTYRNSEIDCFLGTIGDVAATHARYHDLIVVGLGRADISLQATAESVVFGAGRPTLLVPEVETAGAYHHVMIAWDGSRVAARAVADARDFLRLAKTVTVASVTDEKALSEDDPAQKLVDYLARHDIHTAVAQVQTKRRPIAETLQEHASDIGADIMVMGAFGHSRMRDFVLGGATGGILRDLRLPVLLSH